MGKPYVPYTAKRMIEACLESNWDFELSHGPVTLFLRVSNGPHIISGTFSKTPGEDSTGRPTTKYSTVSIVRSGYCKPIGISLDAACLFIAENGVFPRKPVIG
jgi:hypothetical protein